MADYFEIDFLDVESDKSGDAIPLRYQINGQTYVHVVDGGFQATGPSVVKHIEDYYDKPESIDHVIATHPDGDHAGGLRAVLEHFNVETLWMIRPWLYVDEIIHRFETYKSADALRARLKKVYSNLAALEEIALRRGIRIEAPFQGAVIGAFSVLAPTKSRYLDLLVESERTPEEAEDQSQASIAAIFGEAFQAVAKAAANLVRAAWGEEVFSVEETSNENEMSVVQFARIAGKTILLTGDAGRGALREAADYAPIVGLTLPGIDRFQVPHHGSRRNVSTELLDEWLGPRLDANTDEPHFTAVISSAKADTHHPRKSVIRAIIHRGGRVVATEGRSIRTGYNQPTREGWSVVTPYEYPSEQEE